MDISSIDDIVEQGIRKVILDMGHLGRHMQLRDSVVAPLRRIVVILVLVIVSFLFRLQLLLAIAVIPVVLGVIPLWIERIVQKVTGKHAAHDHI